jgi:Ca2+-binding RTX toxin-like protein
LVYHFEKTRQAFFGNDVIYATDRNEVLLNETGDSILVANGGNDTIYGGAGNGILDGGTGNDTYLFRRGSGQDTIIDIDPTPNNVDTIWLGSNLTPGGIGLKCSRNYLVLKINDTTDLPEPAA